VAISSTEVKELRNITGAGVLDCKKALEATNGDFDKAVEYLREKGLAAAAKKATREANEGIVSLVVDDVAQVGAIVEVNCETDFVARTEDFYSFVNALTRQVMQTPDVPSVPQMLEQPFIEDRGGTVGERITQLVASLGENIVLRRFHRLERGKSGLIEGYVHPGNRIGVLVYMSVGSEGVAESPAFADFVHDLALQVAAAAPRFIAPQDVPQATLDAKRAIYRAQLAEEKKPDHIKERIISGKLDKWFEEACLLRQPFVKDSSVTIEALLAQKGKELGTVPTIEHFIRYELGTSE
jgi:elongation factor Ts